MTKDELMTYVQVRTPDVAALANCIILAKGQRTMAQFAADTNISASTLSRIVNLNIKKPLSKEMIISIYENRANEADDYILASLARANGLASPDYAERANSRQRHVAQRNEEMNRKNLMKNAILAGIAAVGVNIQGVHTGYVLRDVEKERNSQPPFRCRPCDFVVLLGDTVSQISQWRVYTLPVLSKEHEAAGFSAPVKSIAEHYFERASSYFLLDSWLPNTLKGVKTSFAFVDEDVFYEFVEITKDASVKNEMSLLLLDPEQGYKVVKEVWLNGNYVSLSNVSIFDYPAPIMAEDDDFYDDYYEMEETE